MPAGLGFDAGDGEQPPGRSWARALLYDFGSEAGGAELNCCSEVENSRMSVNKWVVGVCAGLAACGSFAVLAQSQPSVVFDSAAVQTPTAAPSGLTLNQVGSSIHALVYTQGFYFCNNVPQSTFPHQLTIAHEDQTFSPAHPWSFPVVEVNAFAYTLTGLNFPSDSQSSLECVTTAVDGSLATALADGLFANGYDSKTDENFNHLVNWVPPRGFDWSDTDWSNVPAAACDPAAGETPIVVEDVACAAATGVTQSAAAGPLRGPKMWTATDGINFTYAFRVDTRYGAQAPGAQPVMQVPLLSDGHSPATGATMTLLLQDAYEGGDANHVGYLSNTGSWCILYQLPSTLNSSSCAQAGSLPLSGPLTQPFAIGNPPFGTGADQAFYVIVNRLVQGSHPNVLTPVVAGSVLIETDVSLEGGDRFSGDNAVFGFMPSSTGFPWMTGGQ